ncbi:hypothetical protein S40288_01696 [Stachybotrys chartarum IBT 40288]|nr:hypothetical protein S40288_01696 [Stachybotrys chartarum IBT 40288]
MADPLLTSLCAICHISTPKYKCPRCSIQTCSLSCIKKHKSWSECSGKRDQTAYLPPSKLRTPAGIDHDYNFLHGIELARERAEKVVVGEKALVQEEELRPLTVQEVKWKQGRDGRKKKVLVTRVLREAKGRAFPPLLTKVLAKQRITVDHMPRGMARQKENKTTFHRKSGCINWQVEWLTLETEPDSRQATQQSPACKRVLSKVLETVPLYEAYVTALDEETKAGNRLKGASRGARGYEFHQQRDSTWGAGTSVVQDPSRATWIQHQTSIVSLWPSEWETVAEHEYQFFLARLPTKTNPPNTVARISPKACLRDILPGTTVLEFPAIYVLPGGKTLPSTLVESSEVSTQSPKERRKRKLDARPSAGRPPKKQRQGKEDAEEGEVESSDEENDDDAEDRDDNGGLQIADGLEAGEVIDEQSFGEEDDDDDDDDTTSSSGTDSDSDD